jgi:hypothetical protein
MVETSTQNEMIKAIYHELNSEDMVELEMQLENNAEFENNFEDLSVLKSELNKLIETPSDSVIQNILNYSISYIK